MAGAVEPYDEQIQVAEVKGELGSTSSGWKYELGAVPARRSIIQNPM
jgi:hypothetical protein